jgi:DMSO/TMAO reductase YedYZ heme-binding membrane subunit
MLLALSFLVSFCAVFLKGFQHKNVIGMHYKLVAVTSFAMAAFDVASVSLIVAQGWSVAPAAGAGAALGMVAAMYVHTRYVK